MVRDGRRDREALVTALRELASSIQAPSGRARTREPALRVIDCVLSPNRWDDSFVVPRLDRFEREHPSVRTITDLQDLMAQYPSPDVFVTQVLNYGYVRRAAILSALVRWLAKVSGRGSPAEQLSNVQRWAANARPGDHPAMLIRGFGLVGFQYLRMLFGANAIKLMQLYPAPTAPGVQNNYNVGNRASESVLEHCEASGIAFIPYFPLDGGDLHTIDALRPIAEAHHASIWQIGLAWLLHRSAAMLPVVRRQIASTTITAASRIADDLT